MTTQTTAPVYVKKITTKNVGCLPKVMNELVIEDSRQGDLPIRVVRVYGTARGLKKGSSTYGPFVSFSGEFEAVNLITNTRYRSKEIILPQMAEMSLLDALEEAKKENPEASITFGTDIAIDRNQGAKGGWEFKWAIIPLKQPEFRGENDALSILGKSLGELPVMLEAPKAPEKKSKK